MALTDQLRVNYKNMVEDFAKFFNSSQGSFLGEKNTYVAREGMIDEPSKRNVKLVVTTVDEKLKWFIENSEKFIDALFSQEKTNASGLAKAELVVEGKSWGEYTSLELLRLKSLLENSDLGNLQNMLSTIPVRSDSQIWEKSDAEEYINREIWQTPMISGVARTTEKIEYILQDPNFHGTMPQNYVPKTSLKTVSLEVGDYTNQKFSGEWSHRLRAETLRRRGELLSAIVTALKKCNDAEAVQSELTAKKVFGYLFYGSN